jgi:hypothetical protein
MTSETEQTASYYAGRIAEAVHIDQGKVAGCIADAAEDADVALSYEDQGALHEEIEVQIREEIRNIARDELEAALTLRGGPADA